MSKGNDGDGEDPADKYHLQAEMELDDQRKKVKEKVELHREDLRKKQAAEEKKANKKWFTSKHPSL